MLAELYVQAKLRELSDERLSRLTALLRPEQTAIGPSHAQRQAPTWQRVFGVLRARAA